MDNERRQTGALCAAHPEHVLNPPFILRSAFLRYKEPMKNLLLATFASLALLAYAPGRADGLDGADGTDGLRDHDRARQALVAGEILPLRAILERVEREQPGQVMEVELEQKHAAWIYEVKLLKPDGSLLKLKIDARNGEILDMKQRAAKAPRREAR